MKNYSLLWQALENIEFGEIEINLPHQENKKFIGKKSGPKAQILIKDEAIIDEVISGGDVAFGEAYIQGLWTTTNLINLLTFLTLNAHSLEDFFHAKKFQALILFIKSFLTKNTKKGSKKNIRAHYDLGNEFYQLWLDPTMTYSSAIFNNQEISLFDAQKQKYHNILSKLNDGNIVEIGCGWGGFAIEAASIGKKITCLTISPKQRNYALELVATKNLQNLIEIKLQDYREEKNLYENAVSIEMFEAVGKEYWGKYFRTLHDVLKPNGKAVLQIITIDEQVFKDYKNRVDFIQKHIFPGGVLPAKSSIRNLAQNYGFKIKSEFAFGKDYAKTLEIWLHNFDAKYEEIKNLGFSDEFIRKWRFYLCYCIAGFEAQRTDVVQFELEKIA